MNQNLLKFRIWDKVHNKFLPKSLETEFGFVDFFLDQDGKVTAFQEESSAEARIENISLSAINETTGEIFSASDRFVIQRFTGLTDKNGKEIFEGDVVKVQDYKFHVGNHRVELGDFEIFKVEWQGCGRWNISRCDISNVSTLYQILGNILENPNLIK